MHSNRSISPTWYASDSKYNAFCFQNNLLHLCWGLSTWCISFPFVLHLLYYYWDHSLLVQCTRHWNILQHFGEQQMWVVHNGYHYVTWQRGILFALLHPDSINMSDRYYVTKQFKGKIDPWCSILNDYHYSDSSIYFFYSCFSFLFCRTLDVRLILLNWWNNITVYRAGRDNAE